MTQQPAAGSFPPPTPAPPVRQYPAPGAYPGPPPYVPSVPPPPPSGRWQPERIEAVPGTEFGLVQLRVAPITSGLAIGSMIAGIAAILVSFLALCFGLAGSNGDWGGWVSGAFTLLSVVVGGGAVAVGLTARRQIRNSGQTGRVRFTGRGVAIAGVVCGSTGAGIALVSLALALVLQVSS
jgi:hypothetical protein